MKLGNSYLCDLITILRLPRPKQEVEFHKQEVVHNALFDSKIHEVSNRKHYLSIYVKKTLSNSVCNNHSPGRHGEV